jgi:hypothetical protein
MGVFILKVTGFQPQTGLASVRQRGGECEFGIVGSTFNLPVFPLSPLPSERGTKFENE